VINNSSTEIICFNTLFLLFPRLSKRLQLQQFLSFFISVERTLSHSCSVCCGVCCHVITRFTNIRSLLAFLIFKFFFLHVCSYINLLVCSLYSSHFLHVASAAVTCCGNKESNRFWKEFL